VPVANEPSLDSDRVMSTTLMDADADTPVTLADCFHNPTSCQFLVVVLLRHLA